MFYGLILVFQTNENDANVYIFVLLLFGVINAKIKSLKLFYKKSLK